MFSSANDDLTRIYAGSDDICSSGYDCNSEDVQLENPEAKDDPDSAEISDGFDQVSRQVKTPIETSKKRKLRMMDEDSDGVRIKIDHCVCKGGDQSVGGGRFLCS